MKLIIDGDGCPVKNQSIAVGQALSIPVLIVTSIAHYFNKPHPIGAEVIYVDNAAQMADYKMMTFLAKGDILIT